MTQRSSKAWNWVVLLIPACVACLSCSDNRLAGGGVESTNGAVVAGRFLMASDVPAADAEVYLAGVVISSRGDSLQTVWKGKTDASGWYRFEDVSSGRYVLYGKDAGGRDGIGSRLQKNVDEMLVIEDVTLMNPVQLVGRVFPPPGIVLTKVLACIPGLERCVEVGSDSVYRFASVPQGKYDLVFVSGQVLNYLPVEATAGMQSPLYLEDVTFATAEGEAVMPHGFYADSLDQALAVLPKVYEPGDKPLWYAGKLFDAVHYFKPTRDGRLIERDLEEYTDWSFSRAIPVNTTATGLDIPVALAGYPLLVRLTGTDFDFSQARANGADIRFSGRGGAHLPFEVERWDASLGVADIWVRLDTLRGNDPSQSVNLHWGNPEASSRSRGAEVFPRADGFKGVWHLHDTLNGSVVPDALKAFPGKIRQGGTSIPLLTSSHTAVGTVAGALNFNGKDHYVEVPFHPGLDVRDAFTLSVWARNERSELDNNQALISKWDHTAREWELMIVGTERMELHFGDSFGNWMGKWTSSNALPGLNSWQLYTVTFDRGIIKMYVNGEEISSQARLGTGYNKIPQAVNLQKAEINFGAAYHGTSEVWEGDLDEVRYFGTALSPAWIRADYRSQMQK